MANEAYYRVAVLVLLVLIGAIGGYHRWQAAASGERISHREEGCAFAIALRLAGLCVWIGVLAYLVSPASIERTAMPLAPWLRWCGLGLGALGVLLVYWTMTSLGKNLTDTVVVRREATLVTHGPYRWVRHPFYVTAGVFVVSVTLLTANWLIGLGGLAVLMLLVVRTVKEEQMLIDRFGDDYRRYMVTTGRFFPRLWSGGGARPGDRTGTKFGPG
jgi:protein-S-isoprenylcysteine O-methyltransferase Ste14